MATTTTMMAMIRTTATTPIIMAVLSVELWGLGDTILLVTSVVVVLLLAVGSVVGGWVGEHSSSLRDEMATEHPVSTVISTPVTMILALLLTHFSIRDMSEPLSVSGVPSSLARYVTYVGDLG